MSTEFTVDALELQFTARQASDLSSELDDSALPAGALDGIGGASTVEDAYAGFVSHWSDGLFYARQHLSDLAGRLSSAADAYLQTEQKLENAAQGNSSGATQT